MEDKAFADALGNYITNFRHSVYPVMSSREFAEKSGISRTLISNIETKKHKGNICSSTLSKISDTLGFDDYFQLIEKIKEQTNISNTKKEVKKDENITIKKGTNLYNLFDVAKDLNDSNIEMLHSIALKLK